MKAFFDPVQLSHAPTFFLQNGLVLPYLETPARADALLEGCRALGLDIVPPPPADHAALAAVHDRGYLDFLRDAPALWDALPRHGPDLVAAARPSPEMYANGARRPEAIAGRLGWYAADTSCAMTAATWPAARAAAACALAAADEAVTGHCAYALCRPPGHHAYAARAGGHCYINNAALAAERLRARGARRVAVLDIDAHHGNGTQGIFWTRDDVVFVSLHGDPAHYYPFYVGHADERGAGPGAGCTLNCPLARGTGDADWLEALDHGLAFLRRAGVEALVVSLGFDAWEGEPLQFLSVTGDGFARAGAAIGALRLPMAIVQEGGYAVEALGGLLRRFVGGVDEAR